MTTQPFRDPYLKGRPGDAARQAAARILAGPHLSVLSTTNPDGSPQASVILVKPDGDDVLFSTIKGRRKTANMQRDPRVSLLVHSLSRQAERSPTPSYRARWNSPTTRRAPSTR